MKTRISILSAIAVLTIAFSGVASATEKKPVEVPAAELNYAGKINNQPVFQLKLNNKTNEKYSVVLKDEFGTVLFEETLGGVNISRKYMLDLDEFRGVDVNIEVRSLLGPASSSFIVRNSVSIVTETKIEKK